ncbi:hypothetical protein E1B28_009177 [Marasmius oreades]|uniref:Uncharacterized protein n=1 Tax=Marasmius oreades TaxID=181124 RepID=A0A9P7RZZ0_9AGAR|nr:uncharacterized protein E1B28_009177 [Marasmius oreades]KAG7092864.1 hypothetical protein E1B28_009177 [Marasmius oreades]
MTIRPTLLTTLITVGSGGIAVLINAQLPSYIISIAKFLQHLQLMARTPRNRARSSSTQREPATEREEAQTTLLESYMILASELKSRLLKTQDEKDSLIQTHAQELSDARESWERLQLRFERSKQTIRTLTKERDELKESFGVLLQKVEVCNNFSSWPFPKIHLSSILPEPILPAPTTTRIPTTGFDSAALISRLTQERDEARSEGELVMRESAAKFSMLEAQLALREAELLSLQNENELNRPVRSSCSTEQSQPQLSNADAIRILQYNAAKNRTIQMDIKRMRKKLEIARGKSPDAGPSVEPSSPLNIPRTPSHPQPTAVLDDFNAELQHLASKLDAFQLERAKLSQIIAEEEAAVSVANDAAARNPPKSQSNQGKEVCENCARLRNENAKLQERISELQQIFFPSQTPSPPTQSTPPRTLASSPPLPQSSPPFSQFIPPLPQSTPPTLPPSLPSFEVRSAEMNYEGELSMVLATPLPSTVVLPPTSSRSSSHSFTSTSRSSSSSRHSHPPTFWNSPPASTLLSPFVASTDMEEVVSPAAAAGFLIDLDGSDDPPLRSRSSVGEIEPHIDLDCDLLHSQFRLSELEQPEDNDVTVRPPTPHSRPPLPPSPPRTPGQELQKLGTELGDAQRSLQAGEDIIDGLRDMILELMPDFGKGEGPSS